MPQKIAIFDTNLLPKSATLVESPVWVAVIRLCHRLDIVTAIPEIVLDESLNRRREHSDEVIAHYRSSFRELVRLFPTVDAAYIPATDEILENWNAELRRVFQIFEPEEDDARTALRMEARRRRPAREGRGARDALIWRTVVRLVSQGSTVYFVTNNSADFSASNTSQLHPDLMSDVSDLVGEVHYHLGLDSFIEEHASAGTLTSVDAYTLGAYIGEDVLSEFLQQYVESSIEGVTKPQVEGVSEFLIISTSVPKSYVVDEVGLAVIRFNGTVQAPNLVQALSGSAWTEYDTSTNELINCELVSIQIRAT